MPRDVMGLAILMMVDDGLDHAAPRRTSHGAWIWGFG